MKRILVLLSVVALMVMMLAMSVAPAFAAAPLWVCTNPSTGQQAVIASNEKHEWRAAGYTDCVRFRS